LRWWIIVKVKVFKKEFVGFCCLKITVGTNTPKGGDAGHGGRTILVIEDGSSCAWEVDVDGQRFDHPNKLTIIMYGDDEARRLVEALEFAVKVLKMQMEDNPKEGIIEIK
jgi:hypothetical protein